MIMQYGFYNIWNENNRIKVGTGLMEGLMLCMLLSSVVRVYNVYIVYIFEERLS